MLDRLYNVESQDEWEELVVEALRSKDAGALAVLLDYLRWVKPPTPERAQPLLRELFSHIKWVLSECPKFVRSWVNRPSCEEAQNLLPLPDYEARKSELVSSVIPDERLVRYVVKGLGLPWLWDER
ncbi:hypothetical protein B9Q11_02330 [Candidatus Marsarchaeota G2 archaeon ECH_B_SAG-F08]|uniref:Uncharacterized protein n=4 Tax=Candidatus Marsarchaeota TaxID=1978152 RepID=A0A2R6BII5_9ARCH|nr:MAG: hypothetical protein B9Q01_01305 [Candidatus Marsarchaeota G1 archaeon OSP_D]PSN89508.1 MAG: hypothetical protein B9P99_05465 [Candidatus Marsarchaeota G1 archaeon OSP_B]PSN98395.1 MAG: hypothetical protein B9Q11_02330 [Candidatus Marsarchaeota G2 archaeon ECH_B_SAG-F08]